MYAMMIGVEVVESNRHENTRKNFVLQGCSALGRVCCKLVMLKELFLVS